MSVVLSEHLPLLATAPDGIQKLRGLILELAVRGKLVPQDPNDEPASELLKRIAKERARLEAAGSLKKSKAMPVVGEEDKFFDTPIGWEWARLATIGNIFNGNSINSNEKEAKFRRKDGLPYIATKDVGYGLTPLDYDNGICIPESEPNLKIAHEGAVLICAEGGSAGKKCGITDRNVFFGNKLFANETFAGIPPRLILYLYQSPFFREQFVAAIAGIIGGVSIAKFIEITIPIPPLAEQGRIVAKVDELMALCDRLESEQSDAAAVHERLVATLLGTLTQSTDATDLAANWQRLAEHFDTLFITEASLDALKRTILQLAVMGKLVPQDSSDEAVVKTMMRVLEMRRHLMRTSSTNLSFVDAAEALDYQIPKSWLWQRLEQLLISGPTNGFSPKAVDYETSVRSLTLSATTSGQFIEQHSKFISEDIPPSSDLWLHDGDILVQRGNSLEYVGVAAIYRGQSNRFIYPDLMMRLRVASEIDVRYIHLAMNSYPCREYLRERATGTSGSMPKINQTTLINLPIPLPPLAEQHRIVAKVDELLALVDRLKAGLAESRAQQERLATTLIESALKAA